MCTNPHTVHGHALVLPKEQTNPTSTQIQKTFCCFDCNKKISLNRQPYDIFMVLVQFCICLLNFLCSFTIYLDAFMYYHTIIVVQVLAMCSNHFCYTLHPPFHPCMKGSGSNWKTWHPTESYSLCPSLAQIQSSINLASHATPSLYIQSVMLKH